MKIFHKISSSIYIFKTVLYYLHCNYNYLKHIPNPLILDLQIVTFNATNEDLIFVAEQPRPVQFHLELAANQSGFFEYNFQIYFNGTLGRGPYSSFIRGVNLQPSAGNKSIQYVFQSYETLTLSITLPGSTLHNCTNFDELCCRVSAADQNQSATACLYKDFFTTVCDKQFVG